MKIQGNGPIDGKEIYNKIQDLVKSSPADKKQQAEKTGGEDDRISLSGKAREIAELRKLIEQLPDVRTDKVEAIKKALDSGNYNIDSLKVAEKILEEL